jgi:hypothetical protein
MNVFKSMIFRYLHKIEEERRVKMTMNCSSMEEVRAKFISERDSIITSTLSSCWCGAAEKGSRNSSVHEEYVDES